MRARPPGALVDSGCTVRTFVLGTLEPLRPRLRPARTVSRTFDVVHRTVYQYAQAVERSAHLLRLTPVHDRLQTVHNHEIAVSVPHQGREYDDVFGNRVRKIAIDSPFSEMVM